MGNSNIPARVIFQSSIEFDPKFAEVGTDIDRKDFYKWTQDRSLIYEQYYANNTAWFIALKWSGDNFRVVSIAIGGEHEKEATEYIKNSLEKGNSLSLLSQYSFHLPSGTLMHDGTNLRY